MKLNYSWLIIILMSLLMKNKILDSNGKINVIDSMEYNFGNASLKDLEYGCLVNIDIF